ncbi:MAG: hypothetical protein ACRC33_19545, partial [Gemmataceae bacterium]
MIVMLYLRTVATSSLLLAIVFASGCAGDGRSGVKGTVKYKGQPLKAGMISFIPEGGMSPVGGSPIADGAYEVVTVAGIPAGKYKVSITAPDPSGPAAKVEPVPGESGP